MLHSVFALASALLISSATPAPQAAAQPCAAPQYRQFDFWLGSWRVVDPQGKPAGTNVVTSEYGGCALQEHWVGVGRDRGSSFNIFNAPTAQWHQTWVDNSGALLLLNGGSPRAGVMVLTGSRRTKKGRTVEDRITWTRLSDRRVRQLWDFTADGGKKWSVVFDGIYIK